MRILKAPADSCWLVASASVDPLFWIVAEGCGRRKVGSSVTTSHIVQFVMRLQTNTNRNLTG